MLNPGGALLPSRIFTRPAHQVVHYMIHRRHTRKKGQPFPKTVQSPNSIKRSIIQLPQMGLSRLKIAEVLHVGHSMIDRIVHEWESTSQIQSAKSGGRRRTVTLPTQEFIDV
jgi:hypothetical protein